MLPGYPDRRPWQASQEHAAKAAAAKRKRPRRLKTSLRTAMICGVLPLLFGISVYVGWLFTGWPWLMDAGAVVIVAGVMLCLIGLFELLRFYRGAYTRAIHPERVRRVTGAVAILLVSGFPTALGIMLVANELQYHFEVTVHNTSGQSLEAARLFGGGRDELLGQIGPGEQLTHRLRFSSDGPLVFEAQLAGRLVHTMVESYVTSHMRGGATVTVNADGQAEVTH